MKTCHKCCKTKAVFFFYRASGKRYFRPECKACAIAEAVKRHKKTRTKEQIREYSRKFRAQNPTYNARKQAEFRRDNPGKIRAWNAQSKAAKINATPKWLTKEQRKEIVKIYENCPPGFQVDHIVPLRGVSVSGLHAPWNLQYLTANQNAQKGNRLVG